MILFSTDGVINMDDLILLAYELKYSIINFTILCGFSMIIHIDNYGNIFILFNKVLLRQWNNQVSKLNRLSET